MSVRHFCNRQKAKDWDRKFRIGYFEEDGRTPVTPETRAAVDQAWKDYPSVFRSSGARGKKK